MNTRTSNSDAGSILLEYLVLVFAVGCSVMILMKLGFYSFTENSTGTQVVFFGIPIELQGRTPGLRLQLYFQRLQTGVSMPIP